MMRPARMVSGVLAAAGAMVMAVASNAQAVTVHTITDPRGSASIAQADLRKVTYWTSGSTMYVRWQVQNLVDTQAIPRFDLWDYHGAGHRDYAFVLGRYSNSKVTGLVAYDDTSGVTHYRCQGSTVKWSRNYASNYVQIWFPTACVAKGYRVDGPYADSMSATTAKGIDSTVRGSDIVPHP